MAHVYNIIIIWVRISILKFLCLSLYLIMSHEAFKQFLVIITKLLYNKESFINLDINLNLFKIIISHYV